MPVEPDYYVIDRSAYKNLKRWKERLGTARKLTGDELRDLENALWLLLEGAEPLDDYLGDTK